MGVKYPIAVYWSEADKCWLANPIDLEGCCAHGDSPTDAVAEAEVAIKGWLETARNAGLAIPQTSHWDSLLKGPRCRDSANDK